MMIAIAILVVVESVRMETLPVFDYLDTRMLVVGATRGVLELLSTPNVQVRSWAMFRLCGVENYSMIMD